MSSRITDQQVKAAILEFLINKGRWVAHYHPLDTLIRWLGKKVQSDGKRVKACLQDLTNRGYVLTHKRGETVSLNPAMNREIMDFIEKVGET